MPATLLEDLKTHLESTIEQDFPSIVYRLMNFSDADLQGSDPVLLLRRSGTGGDDDEITQQTDVDCTLVVGPQELKQGENAVHHLRRFLKSGQGLTGPGVHAYQVYSPIIGPVQLANRRFRFMFMIRCFTENQ